MPWGRPEEGLFWSLPNALKWWFWQEPGAGRVRVPTPGAWLCWIPRRRVMNMGCSNGFGGCLHLPELCNYMAQPGVESKEQPSGWSWTWVLPQVGSSWALLITQGWDHVRAILHTQWAVFAGRYWCPLYMWSWAQWPPRWSALVAPFIPGSYEWLQRDRL